MSDPVFINDTGYTYFMCDRDPTGIEPVVSAIKFPPTWLFFWWNTTSETLFFCTDGGAEPLIWIKIPKLSDIPSLPVAFGDVTLLLGSAMVSLPAISFGSANRIELSYKTPDGTPGAIFVSSKTDDIGFSISSTSLLDSSVIHYEVF